VGVFYTAISLDISYRDFAVAAVDSAVGFFAVRGVLLKVSRSLLCPTSCLFLAVAAVSTLVAVPGFKLPL
jgi:hypothetical protein